MAMTATPQILSVGKNHDVSCVPPSCTSLFGTTFTSWLSSGVWPVPTICCGLVWNAVCTPLSTVTMVGWGNFSHKQRGAMGKVQLQRSLAHGVAVLLMPAMILGVVLPAAWQGPGSTRLFETVRRMSESRRTQ